MDNPLVSVCVLTFNSGQYIIETLDSIYDQTYQNIELIVSDDGSSDDTIALCEKWIESKGSRFVNQRLITVPYNTGIPANYNRAVKSANGEWIKPIDGDDTLKVDGIENLLQFASQNPDALFIHAGVDEYMLEFNDEHFIKRLGYVTTPINQVHTADKQLEVLLRDNKVYSASWFINRLLFEKIGYFDEKYPGFEDKPFLIKTLDDDIPLFFLDKVVANYRRSNTSVQLVKNFGGLFVKSSVMFFFDKERYYYHGLESCVLNMDKSITRFISSHENWPKPLILIINVMSIFCSFAKIHIQKKIIRQITNKPA